MGFLAFAIAVFIKTPSHPISIAIVASDAVPIPASTMIGTFDCLTINEIFLSSEAEVITEPLLLLIKKAPFPESPNLTIASPVSA